MKRLVLVFAVVMFAACDEKQMETEVADVAEDPVVASVVDMTDLNVSALSSQNATDLSFDGEFPEATSLNNVSIAAEAVSNLVAPSGLSAEMLMDKSPFSSVDLDLNSLSGSADALLSMPDVAVETTQLSSVELSSSAVAQSLASGTRLTAKELASKL